MGVIDFRAAAGSGSGVSAGRFQRKTTLDDRGDRAVVDMAIKRAKEGDAEALRFLYVRYADNVYGYVTSIVRDEHEAEDITQHVFTKLLTVLPRYEQREVPFSAWILRVARNVAVDHLRTRRPTPTEEPRPTNTHTDQRTSEYGDSLKQALRELPDDQRTVVLMRHLVGLSPTEIAERMGRTESSVHGLHHRARGALRKSLVELECAPATVRRSARGQSARPASAVCA